LTAKELLRHWQTEQVTGQMATWREWRAWRREFKSLGIRQVKEREARSIWHQEKQQAARWWLREQELLPYVITALATLIVGLIAGSDSWRGPRPRIPPTVHQGSSFEEGVGAPAPQSGHL
jgi:hypothetical protein